MGMPKALEILLNTLIDSDSLQGWNIYPERSGEIVVKIRFSGAMESPKQDRLSYRKKSPAQNRRNAQRHSQWIASKHAHEVVSDSAPPVVNDDPIRDPTSTGIMTRSMTVAQSDDIEQLRAESPLHDNFPADASPLNPLADTFSMLLTPVIDTPVVISTDSVVSVSDVDNIPDSPVLDLTECDSCSDVSCTTDPGATDVGNCAMYFCEYGCGVPDQIVSNDGIYYCRKCKFTMCNRCIDGGGHSRHRKYLVVDSSR